MRYINIILKVPSEKIEEVEAVVMEHANYIKSTYVEVSGLANPINTYFTKGPEFNNPANPEDGTTGNILLSINETWNELEDIQAHAGRAMGAPHGERLLSVFQEYGTLSIGGEEIFKH